MPNICNIECLFYFVLFYFCDRSQAFKDNYHGAVIESKKVLATNNAVKKTMEKELKRKQKQVERLQAKEVSLMFVETRNKPSNNPDDLVVPRIKARARTVVYKFINLHD